ncbi:hypothetical protein [Yoonia litorea]|uniref:Membrane-bound lysozyme-inhibitor of c-type lysozyme n=1 Tax=Yoonia litorea TaxID=1123755 RepID=A0A1I6M3B1_9RHOB|nr:hypothetical protein [Yoonia litorea]SFS10143.1 hypothetical protein SAMN05444714_1184 [Yoonia litorea]
MPMFLCASLASPATAAVVTCDLAGVPVSFAIDAAQFAPAQNAGEPPRRRVTHVTMGDTAFAAEPFRLGDTVGFWTKDSVGAETMLVVNADGTAVYADPQAGARLTGTCEVLQ